MRFVSRSFVLALASLGLVATAAGCAGDPIVGHWHGTQSATGSSVSLDYTFKSDGKLDYAQVTTYDTTAVAYGGCVETLEVTDSGYTTSGSGDSRSITFNGVGACQLKREHCATDADNLSETQCPAGMTGLAASSGTYTVSGNTLTITVSGATITLTD